MINFEFQPPSYLSHHVESFWEVQAYSGPNESEIIAIPPELNYDIIFLDSIISYKLSNHPLWTKLTRGAYFVGILTQGLLYKIPRKTKVFCIRLKPFSLANIIKCPLYQFNNKVVRLHEVFEIQNINLIKLITSCNIKDQRIYLASLFVTRILNDNYFVNQAIRKKFNFILKKRGNIRVSEIMKVFSVNNVTLRNQFINHIGLPVKGISKIYRFHYSLALNFSEPSKSFTQLALDAGYYDQSHYIKDFHSFFNSCPRQFFKKQYSIDISQQRIMKRFADFYDPF